MAASRLVIAHCTIHAVREVILLAHLHACHILYIYADLIARTFLHTPISAADIKGHWPDIINTIPGRQHHRAARRGRMVKETYLVSLLNLMGHRRCQQACMPRHVAAAITHNKENY